VTIHVPDHAGYYPSALQMALRLVFQPVSGILLSAQIVGRTGVDKRIDVLSVALQSGLIVFDFGKPRALICPRIWFSKRSGERRGQGRR
jgi:hypothetical protein